MATQTQSRAAAENGNGNTWKQRPAWTKSGFPLTVAVFEYQSESGPPNFSISLTRSFRRDENSEWENSNYLGGGDLLRATRLLGAADGYVQSRLEAYFRARRNNGGNS